ncbi:TolC family protein [Thiomicrorhabdus sp. 6S2-11]|uniref:TolC family protein n=1 Tax=Thiomicrorhabdus marina TaxID=2818442 RepID=A0ABS3Q4Q2_9GAMM|nr:TolC family protein [Thiomicrorhabdus marina]MBO1927312.1 TolC family protein [Thiomicrorhabdus marina]
MQKPFLKYPSWSLLWLISIGFSGQTLAASEVSADYAKLVDQVMQTQPQQMQQQSTSELAKQYKNQAERWISDDLSLHLKHENDALLSDDGVRNYEVGAQATVQLPKQQQAWQNLAEQTRSLNGAQQNYLRWLASGKLRDVSWQYRRAEVQKNAADRAYQQAEELLNKVQLKKKAGDATELDLVMAQSKAVELETAKENARFQFELAAKQFKQWTKTDQVPMNTSEDPQQILNAEQHPYLAWLQAQMQVAQAQVGKSKAEQAIAPSVYFGAIHDQAPGSDHSTLVAQLSIPLGMDQKKQIAVAEEQVNLTNSRVTLAQAQLDLQVQAQEALQHVEQLRQQYVLLQQNVSLGESKLQMMEKAYQLGAVNIESLIRAQQSFLEVSKQLALVTVEIAKSVANLNQINGHVLVAYK